MLKRYRPNYDFQVMHCLTEWDTNKQKKTQNIAVYIVRSYDVLSAFVLFFVLNVYVDAHFLRFHNCIPNIVQLTDHYVTINVMNFCLATLYIIIRIAVSTN